MASNNFTIEIITPITTQLLVVEWIEIESPTGSFVVGPDHSPLISVIRNQACITYKQEASAPSSIIASQGIFTVENNKATIILDQ